MENKVYDLKKRSYNYALDIIKFLRENQSNFERNERIIKYSCLKYLDDEGQEEILTF